MGDTKIYPNPLFGGAQDQRSWCKALKTRSGFPLAAFPISTKFSLASPFQEQIFLKKDASLGRRPHFYEVQFGLSIPGTDFSQEGCQPWKASYSSHTIKLQALHNTINRSMYTTQSVDRSARGNRSMYTRQVYSTSCCYWAVA